MGRTVKLPRDSHRSETREHVLSILVKYGSLSRAGRLCLLVALAGIAPQESLAQSVDSDQDLAKKLANPIASLISVPFQLNLDKNIGTRDDGERVVLNIQPVIPFRLTDDWNLISRTVLPITWQDDVFPAADDQFGLGDTVQSLFLSPQQPSPGGLIWGVGPVVLLPTATDDLLGSEQLGLGPTGVALTQRGPWTFGALANQIWSVAGNGDRPDINRTFLQPFLAYTTPTAWTVNLNTESTYDWDTNDWTVPINLQVSKLIKIGSQPVSIGGGVRYWADSPTSGPEGFGARLTLTFLFPR